MKALLHPIRRRVPKKFLISSAFFAFQSFKRELFLSGRCLLISSSAYLFVSNTIVLISSSATNKLKKSIGFLLSMFTFKPGTLVKLNCSMTFGWSFYWFEHVGGSAIGATGDVFCRFITGCPNVSIKSSYWGSIEGFTDAVAVGFRVVWKASPPLVLTRFRHNWLTAIS